MKVIGHPKRVAVRQRVEQHPSLVSCRMAVSPFASTASGKGAVSDCASLWPVQTTGRPAVAHTQTVPLAFSFPPPPSASAIIVEPP